MRVFSVPAVIILTTMFAVNAIAMPQSSANSTAAENRVQNEGMPLVDTSTAAGDVSADAVKPVGSTAPANNTTANDTGKKRASTYIKAFAEDQKAIWTSPIHLKDSQLPALVGFAFATASLTAADDKIQAKVNPSHAAFSRTASDAGLAMFAGTAATFYIAGSIKDNDKARETGLLAGEAGINALAVSSAMEAIFRRAQPQTPGAGNFFQKGVSFGSFPSNHAAVSWAIATVVAHEYPGWATQALSYGLASAVSAARVTGEQHFASDVLVGSAMGWFIGRQIYNRRHDEVFPHENFGTFQASADYERAPDAMRQGSPYVPLESWVYAAFDRLAALGYAPSGFQNMRPWTRTECARLLQEASAFDPESHPEVASLYRALLHEFARETAVIEGSRNLNSEVESLYTRVTYINGTPLTDSMHFAQTLVDDYGRPYESGFNAITGITAHAESGPLAFYVRGEYQHAPSAPALPDSVRAAIATNDGLPEQPATPFAQADRFHLLDSYAALNLGGWQLSFGKQSLWWGPGYGSEMMFSNNAEPITMLRLNSITPFKLPSFLGAIGKMRSDTFLGQIGGYHFLRLGPSFTLTGSWNQLINPQPYIWGEKLSVQLTENLQVGASETVVFAGLGRPMTWGTFFHTFSSQGNGQTVEPGDRRTGFDFSYRIPWMRQWATLYASSMCEDNPTPLLYPRDSSITPGLYIAKFPKLHNLDLRIESGYTDLPNKPLAVAYVNEHYAGGYTNYGTIMGSWLGPQSRGYQVMGGYWLPGQSKVQFGYRKQVVDPAYLSGGNLQDFSARYDFLPRPNLTVSTGIQYEQWNFPLLSQRGQSNTTLAVQLTYRPGWGKGANTEAKQ